MLISGKANPVDKSFREMLRARGLGYFRLRPFIDAFLAESQAETNLTTDDIKMKAVRYPKKFLEAFFKWLSDHLEGKP